VISSWFFLSTVHLVISANYLQFEGTQKAHYLLQKSNVSLYRPWR